MSTEALTFRAEPDFIEAIRSYADKLGMSVNSALREAIAPVVGFVRKTRTPRNARNDLVRFCGMLKNVDCTGLERTQKAFSVIDRRTRIFSLIPLLNVAVAD